MLGNTVPEVLSPGRGHNAFIFSPRYDCFESNLLLTLIHFTLFYGAAKSLQSCQSWQFGSGPYSESGWENMDRCSARD